MMTKVFIIPGFRESPATNGYKEIASLFRRKGYDPEIVRIHWNNRTMSDYVRDFTKATKDNEGCIVFGFSFGAMIALRAVSELKPSMLFLCSLSPYFQEDLKTVPEAWKKAMGKRRIADFEIFSFADLAKEVDCPTNLLLGEGESKRFPSLKKRVIEASRRIKGASLTVIPSAEHDVGHAAYQEALSKLIDQVL